MSDADPIAVLREYVEGDGYTVKRMGDGNLSAVPADDGAARAALAQVEALVEAAHEIEELARQGKIASESVRVDQEWPVHETIHRFSVIRAKAKSALAPFPRKKQT